jgi:CMP-N,N'-diacetyllegionaminic acid synthase
MSITAVIPARAGSTRLKDKNIAEINGEPLLARKVRQCIHSEAFDVIMVSSDSADYLAIAQEVERKLGYNKLLYHLREPEHSDEKSRTFGETVAHLAALATTDHVAWVPCTAPLFSGSALVRACVDYRKALDEGRDSLVTVHKIQTYLMDYSGAPFNYDPANHLPSQKLPPMYAWAGACWIAPRQSMIDWQYFHGPNPYLHETHAPWCDIDTPADLELARKLAR